MNLPSPEEASRWAQAIHTKMAEDPLVTGLTLGALLCNLEEPLRTRALLTLETPMEQLEQEGEDMLGRLIEERRRKN